MFQEISNIATSFHLFLPAPRYVIGVHFLAINQFFSLPFLNGDSRPLPFRLNPALSVGLHHLEAISSHLEAHAYFTALDLASHLAAERRDEELPPCRNPLLVSVLRMAVLI